MDLDLTSKTAVVTGASIGIGRAIAKGLAREGARVVAVARRKDLLETLVQEVKTQGNGAVIPVTQDMMEEDAAAKLTARATSELGHVDILVNNAGGSRPLPVDAPDSAWDEAIALNFTSYRKLAHALLPQMVEHRWAASSTSPANRSRKGSMRLLPRRLPSMPGPRGFPARSASTASRSTAFRRGGS